MVPFGGRRGFPMGCFVDYGTDGGACDSTYDGSHRTAYHRTCDGAASRTDGRAILRKSRRSDCKAAYEQRRCEDLFHLGLSFG